MPPKEKGTDENRNNPSVEDGSLSSCHLLIPRWVKVSMDIPHGAAGNWKVSW